MQLQSRIRSARRLVPLAAALLLAALMAVPSSNAALAQARSQRRSPWSTRTRVSSRERRRALHRKARLRPQARLPLLRRPPPRLRRLAHSRLPGAGWREGAQGRLGVLLGLPLRGRPARSRPRAGVPAGHAGPGRRQRGSPHLPRGHSGAPAGACGTRFWEPSTQGGGPKPSPGGPSRESTGPCAAWWEKASGEDAANCRGD